jgi:hypothetical protein
LRKTVIDHLSAEIDDDLSWAKPYVDEARASVARGEVISGEEFLRHLNELIEGLRRRACEGH